MADTTVVFSFSEGALEERHNIFLFGLSSNTEYDYQVFVTDANGNGPTASAVQRFRTLDTPDLTPPRLVADPIIIGRTHESASIKFGTDEVSYVAIVFGTDSTDLRAAVPELQGRTTHVIRLTDLADSTLYFYEIEGRDIKGNEFIFPPPGRPRSSFRTRSSPVTVDVTSPRVIAGPIEFDIDPDRITIGWITNVPASTKLDFGVDSLQAETITEDNEIPVNRHRIQLNDLTADTTYFYRLGGRGLNNIEFESNWFAVKTPDAPDTFVPIIFAGPIVTFIGSNNATIEWRTDKNASSRIDFRLEPGGLTGFLKADEIETVTRHQLKLGELEADTTYFYQVSSIAGNGEEVVSNVFEFGTLAGADLLPPKFIEGPDARSVTLTTATIAWVTDELSTSKVEYGVRVFGAEPVLSEGIWIDADAIGVVFHKAVLTGLIPDTEYIFRVVSTDLSPERNTGISRTKRFHTATAAAAALDTVKPNLTGGPKVDFTDKTAVFEWETDKLSDSFVFIRIKNTNDDFRKVGDETKVTTHVVTVTNLDASIEYEFELASRDISGNLFTFPTVNSGNDLQKFIQLRKASQPPCGGGFFFTNQFPDTQKPIIIDGPKVVSKTSETITVQWQTDERSDSFVDFGTTSEYGAVKGDAIDVTNHSITLTNLVPGTVYNYRVSSTDVSNNAPSLSANAAISTEAEADDTPPKITTGPLVVSVTNDQATILWETDELSDTKVEYGLTGDLGLVRLSTEDVDFHGISLTNLIADTTYFFRVSSTEYQR